MLQGGKAGGKAVGRKVKKDEKKENCTYMLLAVSWRVSRSKSEVKSYCACFNVPLFLFVYTVVSSYAVSGYLN